MDIELADAVAVVRDELLAAVARGIGSGIEFVVGPVELEFGVELKVDAKARAGFKAWVISGDVEAGMARARTHRVKVTLTPKRVDGTDVRVSGLDSADDLGDLSGHIGR